MDNFDRSIQPLPAPSKPSVVPNYYKETFDNGLKLIATQSSEIPKIYMRLRISGGDILVDKKRSGLAEFTADLMNESSSKYSSEEISVELQKLGSSISFSADEDGTTMYIETLTKNLDATLEIAQEKLLNPAFNNEDFKRVKNQKLEGMEAMKKNAQYLAFTYFSNQLYGESPFGRVTNEKTIKKIN